LIIGPMGTDGNVRASELPSPAQVHYDTPPPQSEVIQPPPAPLIKDMDSFSDGTTQGSFDFTMCSDRGDGQALRSVAFSPSHPTFSIEIWRDDVVRNTTVGLQEGHPSRGDEDGHSGVSFCNWDKWSSLRDWGQGAGDQASSFVIVSSQRRGGTTYNGAYYHALSVPPAQQPPPDSGRR